MKTWKGAAALAAALCSTSTLVSVPSGAMAQAAPAAMERATVEAGLRERLGAGKGEFWVLVRGRPDLAAAQAERTHGGRVRAARDALRANADRTQAGVRAALLQARAPHKSFFINNAIKVEGDAALLDTLARRADVAAIVADRVLTVPRPVDLGKVAASPAEWNLDRIRAPEAWSQFGQGEGIVIGSLDTGIDVSHPALSGRFRGHDPATPGMGYNFFDPSGACGGAPCDTDIHGTHTMGTMVGDDAGGTAIGVAPGAKFIAAVACPYGSCPYDVLLAAGEWMLAPTDENGLNPDPARAPHVINNSWGGGGGDLFFQGIVQAWRDAGIFPVFSNGNSGPGCSTVGSPADYPESIGVGATDTTDALAWFSSMGPSSIDGSLKPDISAPGQDVLSSVPGGGYSWLSGTSMAAPHVSGAIALLWSAAPSLQGDVAGTAALLESTAADLAPVYGCGGDEADNNEFGEGRLDVRAALDAAPTTAGRVSGQVTDPTGAGLAGVQLVATRRDDGRVRRAVTDGAGAFSLLLAVDEASAGEPEIYDLSATAYGYLPAAEAGLAIVEDGEVTVLLVLADAPRHTLSGTVTDAAGTPLGGIDVSLVGAPVPTVRTDATGGFSFPDLPAGDYVVAASGGGCTDRGERAVSLAADLEVGLHLAQRTDAFGHTCRTGGDVAWIDADTDLGLSSLDDAAVTVELPFPVKFFDGTYTSATISTNGTISFDASGAFSYVNGPLPSPEEPNNALFPYWDDLVANGGVYSTVVGVEGDRVFVVEYRSMVLFGQSVDPFDFQVQIHEHTGRIDFLYRGITETTNGIGATVGLENAAGDVGFQYSMNQPVLFDGLVISFANPIGGEIAGAVVDGVDGLPVSGAIVSDDVTGRASVTGVDGRYSLTLPVGSHALTVSAPDYGTESLVAIIEENAVASADFALPSSRAVLETPEIFLKIAPGQQRTQVVAIENIGALSFAFDSAERDVARVPALAPRVAQAGHGDAATPPPQYQPRSAAAAQAGGDALVLMDYYPWNSDLHLQVFNANGIRVDIAGSAELAGLDLSTYGMVYVANDQPQFFYDTLAQVAPVFDAYVADGGFLLYGAASVGWNGGDGSVVPLPGGVGILTYQSFSDDVLANGHPTMQGVADPFEAGPASMAGFDGLPEGATVLTMGLDHGLPTGVEYDYGAGRVLALGQPMEFNQVSPWEPNRILENAIPYAAAFEPFVDVPWLALDPARGTVEAGASTDLAITVDTTGMSPGFYRARIVLVTNDPRNPRLEIPVTLNVPAFTKALNPGGGLYTDVVGDVWEADAPYTVARGFGYINKKSTSVATARAIAGTEDDALYKNLRRDPTAYRFDGLPSGTYEVELLFAEIVNKRPGAHLFDVIAEDIVLLPAHDIALEVGTFTAEHRRFLVPVTDGRLDVRFVNRAGAGKAEIGAIRVTQRPDR
ncbi:S8 family serine peptidase [Myxococcota bacterium]|nr:S8 family serine peptidase [Myxococcota bacterium]